LKKKIHKIWGVGLTVVIAASLILWTAPVSAGTLSWGAEDLPDELEACHVTDLAVSADGGVIYATTGSKLLTGDFTVDADTTDAPSQWTTVPDYPGALTGTINGVFTGTAETGLQGDFAAVAYVTFNTLIEATLKISGTIIDGATTDTMTFSGTVEITDQPEGAGWSVDDETVKITNSDGLITFTDGGFTTSVALVGDGTTTGPGIQIAILADSEQVGAIYRSTNGGESWSTLSNPTGGTVPQLVAVAPDDENYIAVVADNKEVYVSDDAGANWDELTELSALSDLISINDLAISAAKGGNHYVAVAGDTGILGEVWYYKVGGVGSVWTNASAEDGFDDDTPADEKFAGAVAFSPNFASDEVMVAITADGTAVLFQIFSFDQTKWNGEAGFDGYPVDLTQDTNFTLASLDSASIALSPDYLGSDDSMRLAFVGLALTGGSVGDTTGIQRVEDDDNDVLKDDVNIHSVVYDGTNLVAGRYDSTTVYRCADPLGSSPSVKGSAGLKSPGGDTLVLVAFAGNKVVAGTSGDESAFAVSGDDGKTFNDISLIDTTLSVLSDVAVSADGSNAYLVTDDGSDLSLWRYASAWERVLAVDGKTGFIVRTAPDDMDVVYIAEKDSTKIYYSTSAGQDKWHTRISTVDIVDLAVETDGSVVYAATSGGYVSKSTNSGFTWSSKKSSKLSVISMIVSLGEDLLLAGSTDGKAAYTTDGNSSWTKLSGGMTSGSVQVAAEGLDEGDLVVAGVDDDTGGDHLYRWDWDDEEWDDITDVTTDYVTTGIALQDGVLYAVAANITDSKLYRSLNPTSDDPSFNTVDSAGELFNVAPSALRVSVSDTTVKLWAIDSPSALFSYKDTLAAVAPTLLGPADGFINKMNPISGKAFDITFSWERPSKNVDAYDFVIALDSAFNEVVLDQVREKDSSKVGVVAGPAGSKITSDDVDSDFSVEYMPDTTYYWRVRVDAVSGTTLGPIRSPWSEVRSFTIVEAPVAPPVTVAPTPEITVSVPPAPTVVLPAPEIIIPTPEIVLPAPQVTLPPTPAPVAPIPGWALYVIIIIGAVLVIALIVLILRTRRPI